MVVPEGMQIKLPGKKKTYRDGDAVPAEIYDKYVKKIQPKIDNWVKVRKEIKDSSLKKILADSAGRAKKFKERLKKISTPLQVTKTPVKTDDNSDDKTSDKSDSTNKK